MKKMCIRQIKIRNNYLTHNQESSYFHNEVMWFNLLNSEISKDADANSAEINLLVCHF